VCPAESPKRRSLRWYGLPFFKSKKSRLMVFFKKKKRKNEKTKWGGPVNLQFVGAAPYKVMPQAQKKI
jgi:hypothetical protein